MSLDAGVTRVLVCEGDCKLQVLEGIPIEEAPWALLIRNLRGGWERWEDSQQFFSPCMAHFVVIKKIGV